MLNKIEELYGRQINASRIAKELLENKQVDYRKAIKTDHQQIVCQRCGMKLNQQEARLPNSNYYCPVCLNLGRVSTLNPLVTIPEPNDFPSNASPLTWRGRLTAEQARCSKEIIEGFNHHQSRLLWAVTGAGKTEMLFPGIEWALRRKMRVGIASPRVDVCLELYPRIKAAFQHTSLVLLHGKSKQKYRYTQLVICTVHQLLRFYRAFDVLIIDEVDAFPLVHNPPLQYAIRHAVKIDGRRLFLTATPTRRLLRLVHRHQLAVSRLPIRFHRHLLPVIKCHLVPGWRNKLKKKLPKLLIRIISHHLRHQLRFLLFVPKISDLSRVSLILKRYFNPHDWRTVYSQDPQRLSKVKLMREKQVKFLITTTILERGVTFPGIDVIILGADNDVFSTSSLVQIAGRVGRKKDRPYGNVDFFIHSYTRSVIAAQRQIHHLNYWGAKLL